VNSCFTLLMGFEPFSVHHADYRLTDVLARGIGSSPFGTGAYQVARRQVDMRSKFEREAATVQTAQPMRYGSSQSGTSRCANGVLRRDFEHDPDKRERSRSP
jgi:hypothetical protein